MSASLGRLARVKVATTLGGSYTTVAGVNTTSIKLGDRKVDVTTLTDADVVQLSTLKTVDVTLQCNFEGSDTNGQNAIRAAYEAGSNLFCEFLFDGTNGWKFQVLPTLDFNAGAGDKAAATYELAGTGAKTVVP